jgi:flagellar protein FlbD
MGIPYHLRHSSSYHPSRAFSEGPKRFQRRPAAVVGGGTGMIALTHFGSGNRIALNVDLIEKVEETPDTVITLTNGTRYLVQESLDEIIARSVEARARAIFVSQHLPDQGEPGRLRLVREEKGED